MKRYTSQLIQWTWCLPQNLVGAVTYLITKIQKCPTERYNETFITRWKLSGGISLGQFIFVSESAGENTIKHEYGHSRQSLRLGWLYLFIIGLPSICWAAFGTKYRAKHGISYYDFFTERNADKLGGVERP